MFSQGEKLRWQDCVILENKFSNDFLFGFYNFSDYFLLYKWFYVSKCYYLSIFKVLFEVMPLKCILLREKNEICKEFFVTLQL